MAETDHPLRRNLDVLRAELEESIAQARRGETISYEEVLAGMRRRDETMAPADEPIGAK